MDSTLSPYAYVAGNPLNATDPSGLMTIGGGGGDGLIVDNIPENPFGLEAGGDITPPQDLLGGGNITDNIPPSDLLGAGNITDNIPPETIGGQIGGCPGLGGSALDVNNNVNFSNASDSPVGEIVRENGVKIGIHSNDHAPPHAHVTGGGQETRIGQNGKPIKDDPELTPQQRAVVENNIAEIRDAIGNYMEWFRKNL